jgi:hypothetical protein
VQRDGSPFFACLSLELCLAYCLPSLFYTEGVGVRVSHRPGPMQSGFRKETAPAFWVGKIADLLYIFYSKEKFWGRNRNLKMRSRRV